MNASIPEPPPSGVAAFVGIDWLQVLDNDTSTALAADLLLQWPSLEALQKVSPPKLRKFFYGHNCRQEQKLLERLRLIKEAKPLVRDPAVIEPAVLRLQMLARATQNPFALYCALQKADCRTLRLPSR